MEKIINLKYLSKIKFEYGKIDNNELSKVVGVNLNSCWSKPQCE